jgi:hypothetical protein
VTIEKWLFENNFSVYFQPRGFQIENPFGEARFVEVIPVDIRLTRFVTYADVERWVRENITDSFFGGLSL